MSELSVFKELERAGHYKTISWTGEPQKTRRRPSRTVTRILSQRGHRGRGGKPGACPPAQGKGATARPALTMMFPGLLAPPAGYPSLLRPTPTLTLPQSLQSAFSGHSSFLVEDLIRISRPPTYLSRSIPAASLSPPSQEAPAALADSGTSDLGSPGSGSRRGSSPQTALSPASEPTFLKFGVNAILSSAPRRGKIQPCPRRAFRGLTATQSFTNLFLRAC